MSNKKVDQRAHIAMRMVADIFLKSTTKFSNLSKLPKLTQVDKKLNQRALAAIESKSPQNKRININRVSQLGSSPLWKGLDFAPHQNKKSSGNQQRHQVSNNESPASPQQYRNQTHYNNAANQKQQQIQGNTNNQNKPIYRQHNRNPDNEVNTSRNLAQTKQVRGNMVSQNLLRNQKSTKDDFEIGDNQFVKRRKYSNENNKSVNSQNKIMTLSRAQTNMKDKTVSFSPQKTQINKRQISPQRNSFEVKTTPLQKHSNTKQQPYVYVPPKRRNKEEEYLQLPIQSQTILPNTQFQTQIKERISPTKITKIVQNVSTKKIQSIQRTPRPIQKVPITRSNLVEQNIKISNDNVINSNISINVTQISMIQKKNQLQSNLSPRTKVQFSSSEMKQDGSKIRQNLKQGNSISPSIVEKKNVSQRQDIAMKMLAQLFLNASTRYSPGMSMLLKRGITKEEIEQIRSKSSELNINLFGLDRKSPFKQQPKTDRKLNWRQNEINKNQQKQNSRMYKDDVTAAQYKTKKPQQTENFMKVEQQTESKVNSRKQEQKQSSKQLIASKSSTSILQMKNVNYGQNTLKNSQIKSKNQETKPKVNQTTTSTKPLPYTKPNASQKNASILTSKSQTSLFQPAQQTKKAFIQFPNVQSSSTYVYQPPSFIKKDNNIGTQQYLPTKNENSSTLRTVQSEKNIKNIDDFAKNKVIQSGMIKKEQKIVDGNTQKNTQVKTTNNRTQISEHLKEPSLLAKKFCSIIAWIIKKRITSNYSFSLNKIQEQSQKTLQTSKHASYLCRSTLTFVNHYESKLQRVSFNKIKSSIVYSINKIIKENKPVEENHNFISERKQKSAKIIFLILKEKLLNGFQPLKIKHLTSQNKVKTTQQVAKVLARILTKKTFIVKKEGFKKIHNQKYKQQVVLEQFVNTLRNINYKAISDYFSTFVSKNIKQLSSKVKNLKPTTSILSRSKSQQVIASSRSIKQDRQALAMKLSPQQESKIVSKRKQLDRKINDLDRKKQSLQQQVNLLNKEKRAKTKKNAELKVKMTELQKELQNQQPILALQKTKSQQSALSYQELIPVLTRIYAYLFEDPDSTQISVERFLSDNQHCFQLPTNAGLLNEWKLINKNAQLKKSIKIYEGEQPREKQINQLLQEQNQLMSKLMRSFVRERYIWEWVNIIAHQ